MILKKQQQLLKLINCNIPIILENHKPVWTVPMKSYPTTLVHYGREQNGYRGFRKSES